MRDLVLLPGLNNTELVFADVAQLLAADARVHTPTLPALDTLDAIADRVLDAAPPRFHLCGFSFGGYVALATAARAPDRVTGLALLCTGTTADTPEQVAFRKRAIETARTGDYEGMVAKQAPIAFHPASLQDAPMMARRAKMVTDYGIERFVAHVTAAMHRPDQSAVLARFAGPVALIAGAGDKVFPPASMRAFVAHQPRASFHLVEEAGHLVPMERPHALAAVLRAWLARG